MSFPAYWTEEGIVAVVPNTVDVADLLGKPPPVVTATIGGWQSNFADMNPASPDMVAVRWHELKALAAVEPWPHFRITWRWRTGGSDQRTFGPGRRSRRRDFGAKVEALFDHVSEHAPRALERGWLDAPVVPWEQVRRPPSAAQQEAPGGAYRTQRERVPEHILAERSAPTAFETLSQWLASSPDTPFADHPREIIVTDQHVYVRHRDGLWYRLPLLSLRLRRGGEDAVYIFGRHTPLLLPHRDGCPVRAALDERLPAS